MNNQPEPEDVRVVDRFVKLYQPENFIHHPSKENLFYSGAANLGVTFGDREIIGILNADTELRETTLDDLYKGFHDYPDAGVLGPLQYDEHNKVTHGGIFGTLSRPEHRGWHAKIHESYRNVAKAVTVSGSAYFIRRAVWDELHGCDVYNTTVEDPEGAFLPTSHYYEETWCSYHAQAHHYDVMYYGQAEMMHRWHTATPKGGWSDQQMPLSRIQFRQACDDHGIAHD